jgi:muramoyltetrapeptide carboxypeptidase
MQRGYLAGSDEARAKGLMELQRDPSVHAILCGAGGYGCTRILPLLDFGAFRADPKILAGFSDITGLHLALQAAARIVTFHAPMPVSFLTWKKSPPPAEAVDSFWQTLRGEGPAPRTYSGATFHRKGWAAMRPGVAEGILTGGNLALVCSLMGTPYEIQTRGRILFLEDVGEEPYRVDRMLSQLRNAGKLDSAAGVILGSWSGCDPEDPDRSLSVGEVIDDYFRSHPGPVIRDFPAGHQEHNLTLPFGLEARLETDPPRLVFPRAAVSCG